MDLSKFGEGFWVTMMFMFMVTVILSIAMATESPVAQNIVTAIITVLGMIAAFWFPTRGQSSGAVPAIVTEALKPAEEPVEKAA